MPGAARQPAGIREKRTAEPGRLLLPDRAGSARKRETGGSSRPRRQHAVASVDGSHRQRRADRQSGGIRAAEPSSRSGIRPVVHRPLDARPSGRFDLQPGCGHSPANPPHGVHRAQRAHGERYDRGHRHGRLGHIPCRRHPENALFPDRGQHLRRGGDSGTGSGFAAQGSPHGRREHQRPKIPLSGADTARARRTYRQPGAHRSGDAGRHRKSRAGHLLARTRRIHGGRGGEKRARSRPHGGFRTVRRRFQGYGVPRSAVARLRPAAAHSDSRPHPAPRNGRRRQRGVLGRFDALGRRRGDSPARPAGYPQRGLWHRITVRQLPVEQVFAGRFAGPFRPGAAGRGQRIRSAPGADPGEHPPAG